MGASAVQTQISFRGAGFSAGIRQKAHFQNMLMFQGQSGGDELVSRRKPALKPKKRLGKSLAALAAAFSLTVVGGGFWAMTHPAEVFSFLGKEVLQPIVQAGGDTVGNGLISFSHWLSPEGNKELTLDGKHYRGEIAESTRHPDIYGGYVLLENVQDRSKNKEEFLNFLEHIPLECRIYLDPEREEMMNRLLPDERLAYEPQIIDGVLMQVKYDIDDTDKVLDRTMLAIVDQRDPDGRGWVLRFVEVPKNLAAAQDWQGIKNWGKAQIEKYKKDNTAARILGLPLPKQEK